MALSHDPLIKISLDQNGHSELKERPMAKLTNTKPDSSHADSPRYKG